MKLLSSPTSAMVWVAHASRVLVSAPRRNNLSLCSSRSASQALREVRDREDALASTRDARTTQTARSKQQ